MNAIIAPKCAQHVAPSNDTKAYVPTKLSLTNRIGRHFARIKAVATGSLPIMVTAGRSPVWSPSRTGKTPKGTSFGARSRERVSGNVRTVGGGDHAAHDAVAGFGVRARAARCLGSFDDPPGAAVGHQGRQHRVVELVAAAHRTIGGKQRQAGEREIADDVQNLVAGAFVAVTQPLAVEQAGIVQPPRNLERPTQRETGAPEPRHIVHAAEGTGARNLAAEAFRAEIERIFLAAD